MTNTSLLLPIAVTCGDPSGIGPDVILEAWLKRVALNLPAFYVLGDVDQLRARAAALGLTVAITQTAPAYTAGVFATALPVFPLEQPLTDNAGVPLTQNAGGIIEAIDRAFADCVTGEACAMVTAPIAKKPLYDAGFRHPGHTEYLAHLAHQHYGSDFTPIMMIAAPQLRTIPVTIHIPLNEVSGALTKEAIVEAGRIANHDLRKRLGIAHPRLAIAGLNPHAGEDGAMGREDIDVIMPAVAALQNMGIEAVGPLPADTMFHAAARAKYDVAICMYHDQALIPAKALGFDDGVNVTLGLPFIRTSPDHGTAFGIAGKGIAKPDSFIAALKMAAQMASYKIKMQENSSR